MKKKVLIAHVPYEHRGGEDVHVEFLVKAYREIGIPVEIYSPLAKSKLMPAIRSFSPGVDLDFLDYFNKTESGFIHLHNAFPLLGPKFFKTVVDHEFKMLMTVHNHRFYCTNGLALREGKVCKDCFHDRENGNLAWKSLVRNCNSDPVKSSYHSLAMSEMNRNDLYRRSVTAFLAPSPYIQEELIRWGAEKSKVELLMNPIADSGTMTKTENPKIADCDVFYAGRLSEEKGIRNLIELVKRRPSLNFVIAGNGPLKPLVAAAAKTYPQLRYFESFSHDEVLAQIAKTKVGILASICNEILPTFVLECFTSGKACVVPDLDSTRWLDLEKSGNKWFGVAANTMEIESIEKALSKALKQPSVTQAQVDAARRELDFNTFKSNLESVVQKRVFS